MGAVVGALRGRCGALWQGWGGFVLVGGVIVGLASAVQWVRRAGIVGGVA
ncbi:hypothetical protein JOD54_005438 [Actinokineospora baliensis]|nr:hypothetical protein [Actinokineospora baliensis]